MIPEELQTIYITNLDEDALRAPITAISFVEHPATESQFITFSSDISKFSTFASIKEGDNHSVLACLIRADFPILRKNDSGQYFNMVFTKDSIREIAERYTSSYFNSITNVEHNTTKYSTDNKLVEIFIKDVERGINPSQFTDIEDGSLFVTMKITDEELWGKIQSGEIKGLSLEGYYPIDIEIKSNTNMKLSFKEIANKLFTMSAEFPVEQGVLYVDDLTVGAEVILVGNDGEEVYPVNGTFKVTVDEKELTITVVENVVTDIEGLESIADEPVEGIVEPAELEEVVVEEPVAPVAPVVDPAIEELRANIEAIATEVSQQREMIIALQAKIDEFGQEPKEGFSKVDNKLPKELERLQDFLKVK